MLSSEVEKQCKRFNISNCRLSRYRLNDDGSITVWLEDNFGEKVKFIVDVNGIVREAGRV